MTGVDTAGEGGSRAATGYSPVVDATLLVLLLASVSAAAAAVGALPLLGRPRPPRAWLGWANAVAAGTMLGASYVLTSVVNESWPLAAGSHPGRALHPLDARGLGHPVPGVQPARGRGPHVRLPDLLRRHAPLGDRGRGDRSGLRDRSTVRCLPRPGDRRPQRGGGHDPRLGPPRRGAPPPPGSGAGSRPSPTRSASRLAR